VGPIGGTAALVRGECTIAGGLKRPQARLIAAY
jgi:hypothetical protein